MSDSSAFADFVLARCPGGEEIAIEQLARLGDCRLDLEGLELVGEAQVDALTSPRGTLSLFLAIIRFDGVDWLVGELGAQVGEIAPDGLHHHDADRIAASDGPVIVPQRAFLGEDPGRWLPIAFRIDGKRVPVLGRLVDGHVKDLLDEVAAPRGSSQPVSKAESDIAQGVAFGAREDFGNGRVARIGRQAAGQSALQGFAQNILRWLEARIKAAFGGRGK